MKKVFKVTPRDDILTHVTMWLMISDPLKQVRNFFLKFIYFWSAEYCDHFALIFVVSFYF